MPKMNMHVRSMQKHKTHNSSYNIRHERTRPSFPSAISRTEIRPSSKKNELLYGLLYGLLYDCCMIVVWDVHATITPSPRQSPAQRQAECMLERRVYAEPQRATQKTNSFFLDEGRISVRDMADGKEGRVRS